MAGISTKGPSERYLDVKRAFVEVYPFLLLCTMLDFVGGYFLGKSFDRLMKKYPLVLLILPSIMGLRGNVFGASASRISTALHVGYASPKLRDPYILFNHYLSIAITNLPIVFLIVISLMKLGVGRSSLASVIIVITSSLVISYVLSSIAVYITVGAYRRGLDPDNIIGPMITTVADVITIPSIVFFMYLYEISPKVSIALFLLSLVLFTWVSRNMLNILRKEELSRERKLFKEIVYVLSVLAMVSLGSGSLLEGFSRIIHNSYIVAVIYPVILDSLGNYGSVIGARASTQYHLGLLRSPLEKESLKEVLSLFSTGFVNSVMILMIGAVISHVIYGITPVLSLGFILIFIATYGLVALGVMILAVVISYYSGAFGWDPDNLTIPLITTLADLIGSSYAVLLSMITVKFFV